MTRNRKFINSFWVSLFVFIFTYLFICLFISLFIDLFVYFFGYLLIYLLRWVGIQLYTCTKFKSCFKISESWMQVVSRRGPDMRSANYQRSSSSHTHLRFWPKYSDLTTSAHQRNAIWMAFRYWAECGSRLQYGCSYLPSLNEIKGL